ncbi:MAG: nucleoside hydrolase, partial [Phycisphaeraceae bacterium]|nr:nucleoside hydrolase [Phycisphaeraceae bacterium]
MPFRLSSYFTALVMLLIFTSVRAEADDSRRRVLLCADVAMGLDCTNVFDSPPSAADPDDAWALAWALNHPGWDVVGVVVSFGNCACETPSTNCDAPAPEPGQVPCEIL